jgi:hypothetical protein
MPLPASYSELTFADYLTSQIEKVASVLGWDAGSVQVIEAVNDALLDLGETDIATVTDFRGLRALGRRAIWRAVAQATAGNYSFTDVAQQKFDRQQINAQALAMLKVAEGDCQALGVGVDETAFAVQVMRVVRPSDPYTVLPDSERVIA